MHNTRNSRRSRLIWSSTAIGALMLAAAGGVHAQDANSAAAKPQDDSTVVVVTGLKSSLQSAVSNKKKSKQIVDSIVAEDIGKLPDNNVADALSRVTGVQITRENGEGKNVLIRGMTQVVAEIDGRPVFTAGFDNSGTPSRILNFDDIPSELIARADVYKSPVADQIEGGIGGLINFVTRKPLDFKKPTMGLNLQETYSADDGKTTPAITGFYATQWDTGLGRMGAWVSATHADIAYRTEGAGGSGASFFGTPTDTNGNAYYPTMANDIGMSWGNWAYSSFGDSVRDNVKGDFEWRPNDNLDLFADYVYNKRTQDDHVSGSWVNFESTFLTKPTLAKAADGTQYVVAGDFMGPVMYESFIDEKTSVMSQGTIGGTYTNGPWTLYAEAYAVRSNFHSYFAAVESTVNEETVFDFSSRPGELIHPGTDPLDLNNYTTTKLNYADQHTSGDENAAKFDITRDFSSGILTRIKAGVRYADRTEGYYGGNPFTPISVPALQHANIYTQTPFDNFMSQSGGNFYKDWMEVNWNTLKNAQALNSMFGYGTINYIDPSQTFSIEEKAGAAYVLGEYAFQTFGIPTDGNIGVRFVDTKATDTSMTADVNGVLHPQVNHSDDKQTLPSFNIRFQLTPNFFWRLAASKMESRPEFKALNPALFIQYNLNTGYAGNPDLPPLTANQYDSSWEWYFSKTGYLSGAVFHKDVQGFEQNLTKTEVINGFTLQMTRPYAASKGTIDGFEIGYQQFFDFLPSPFDGFGVNANYTRVDSKAPDGSGGTGLLPGLSKDNYNLILMYEKGPLSARLAYNWRSYNNGGFSSLPWGTFMNVNDAQGILDAGLNYSLNSNISLTFDATNLNKEPQYSSYDGIYGGVTSSERRYTVGIRMKY